MGFPSTTLLSILALVATISAQSYFGDTEVSYLASPHL